MKRLTQGKWIRSLLLLAAAAGPCGCQPNGGGEGAIIATVDLEPPAVVSIYPEDGARDVSSDVVLSARFSEDVDPASVHAASFRLSAGAAPAAGAILALGREVRFIPSTALQQGATYTVVLTTDIRDLAGNRLRGRFTSSFSTRSPITPARIVATDPPDGATGVPPDPVIAAVFSKDMDAATIHEGSFLVSAGANAVAGSVSYAARTARFVPHAPLARGVAHTTRILATVRDADGADIEQEHAWTFTVEPEPPAPPVPAVIHTVPARGASGAPVEAAIEAVFLTDMDPSTLNAETFLLYAAGQAVSGAVTYENWVARFMPDQPLMNATLYEARITSGARDVSGTPLPADSVWMFATALAPDPEAPPPPQSVFGVGSQPGAAVDPAGNAMVVWIQIVNGAARVMARRIDAGAGPEENAQFVDALLEGGARNPAVAMDGEGRAIAVWEADWDFGPMIVANRFSPDIGWGVAEVIGLGSEFSLAADASGAAVVVWLTAGGLAANVYLEGWDVPRTIIATEAAGAMPSAPRVAMDGSGNAMAVLRYRTFVDGFLVEESVRSCRMEAGSGWGAAQTAMSYPPGPLPSDVDVDLAMDASGGSVAAFARDGMILLARHDGADWAALEVAFEGTAPRIAMSGAGVVALIHRDAVGALVARRLSPDEGSILHAILGHAGPGLLDHQVAVDPDGALFAAWVQLDGFEVNVASRSIGADGALRDVRLHGPGIDPHFAANAAGAPFLVWVAPGDLIVGEFPSE